MIVAQQISALDKYASTLRIVYLHRHFHTERGKCISTIFLDRLHK